MTRKMLASACRTGPRDPRLSFPAAPLYLVQGFDQAPLFEEHREDSPDPFGFEFVHLKFPAPGVQIVAEYRMSASPFSFASRRTDLVPGSLANDLAFELGKREQNIQCELSERSIGIKLLG